MTLFESRNVLDRLESTWALFWSRDWRITMLPQMILGIAGVCVSLLMLYLLFLSTQHIGGPIDIMNIAPENLFPILEFLTYLLLFVVILTLVGGMIQTYVVTVCHDFHEGVTLQELAKIAWSRLWGWMWYYVWIALGTVVLLATDVGIYFLLPDISWIYWLLSGVGLVWAIISFGVGFPEYTLANSWSLGKFLSLTRLTRGRWWRVLGNFLVVSLVIGSALSLSQHFLFWIAGGYDFTFAAASLAESVGQSGNITWDAFVAKVSVFTWIRLGLGSILFLVLYFGQRIFTGMFQYVMWKEIVTEEEGKVSE